MSEPIFQLARYQVKSGVSWQDSPRGATEIVVTQNHDPSGDSNALCLIGYNVVDRASDGYRFRLTMPKGTKFEIMPDPEPFSDDGKPDNNDESDSDDRPGDEVQSLLFDKDKRNG